MMARKMKDTDSEEEIREAVRVSSYYVQTFYPAAQGARLITLGSNDAPFFFG